MSELGLPISEVSLRSRDVLSPPMNGHPELDRLRPKSVPSLNLVFPTRFFSPSLLLDEPQPRKTNGEDHHDDENGVLYHRSPQLH
jgi:hypothetical protein